MIGRWTKLPLNQAAPPAGPDQLYAGGLIYDARTSGRIGEVRGDRSALMACPRPRHLDDCMDGDLYI